MSEYYISGCKSHDGDIATCSDDEAEFWTLYQRMKDGTSQGIIDLKFREDAQAAMKVYVELDALQQKLDAVVAKGMELAQEAAHVYAEYNKQMAPDVVCDGQTIQEFHDLANGRSSIDAYLNAVRAEGVEMFAKHCDDSIGFIEPEDEELYTLMEEQSRIFAAQLRADAAKDGV